MTADPRDQISEFTEIEETMLNPHVAAFIRAVCWGAVAGGAVFLLATVPIGIAAAVEGEFVQAIAVALLPLAIAGAGSLAGLLLIGLPLTALLHSIGRESAGAYGLAGAIGGLLLPTAILAVTSQFEQTLIGFGMFLGLFGLLAGSVTGQVWGTWREGCAAAAAPDQPRPGPNPIHDLLH